MSRVTIKQSEKQLTLFLLTFIASSEQLSHYKLMAKSTQGVRDSLLACLYVCVIH